MSNVEKLANAGVVKEAELSEEEKTFLDSLTPHEVETLAAIREKAGKSGLHRMMEPKII